MCVSSLQFYLLTCFFCCLAFHELKYFIQVFRDNRIFFLHLIFFFNTKMQSCGVDNIVVDFFSFFFAFSCKQ
jgi:hypothetical protein